MTLQTTKLTERELDAAITRHFAPPRRHVAHLREPYRDTMPVAPAPAEAATHIGHDEPDDDRPTAAGVLIWPLLSIATVGLASLLVWLAKGAA